MAKNWLNGQNMKNCYASIDGPRSKSRGRGGIHHIFNFIRDLLVAVVNLLR